MLVAEVWRSKCEDSKSVWSGEEIWAMWCEDSSSVRSRELIWGIWSVSLRMGLVSTVLATQSTVEGGEEKVSGCGGLSMERL